MIQLGSTGQKTFNLGPNALTAPITCTISKDGGAFGAPSAGAVTVLSTLLSNTWVSVTFDATDSDTLGDLAFHFIPTLGVAIDPPAEQVAPALADVNVAEWDGTSAASFLGTGGTTLRTDVAFFDGTVAAGFKGATGSTFAVDVTFFDGTVAAGFKGAGTSFNTDVKFFDGTAAAGYKGAGTSFNTDIKFIDGSNVAGFVSGAGDFLKADVEAMDGTTAAVTLDGNNLLNVNAADAGGAPWVTPAVPGDEMDLVNAPNATALAAIASGVWNLTDAAYIGITPIMALRGCLSSEVSNTVPVGPVFTIRDPGDTKDVITATLAANGQRTVTARDLT